MTLPLKEKAIVAALAPAMTVVVVSYNTREMTLACLDSVFAETGTPFELIVVDNASTDGSADAIAAAFPPHSHPNLRLIRSPQNLGFGPAHRLARKVATTEWLLLLNPDTVVLDGALDRLRAFAARRPEAGIWGGRTLYGDGSLNPTSCFSRMTLWSIFCRVAGLNRLFHRSALFNSEYFGAWDRGTEREVDIVTGCLFLIRRDLWDRLEGFDDAFVMYGEEVDLCLRARAAGARPRVTPDATIIHHGGASQPVRADRTVRLMKAKMELIRRHLSPATRGAGLRLFALWPLSRWAGFGLGALLLRRDSLRGHAAVWREVWQRRAEWRRGFADAPQP